VGDFDGYLHWLDPATGTLLARGKTGAGRMTNPPVAADGLLLLESDGGEVQAWRAAPRSAG
jgi:outer membrane protein assembly factor BamB